MRGAQSFILCTSMEVKGCSGCTKNAWSGPKSSNKEFLMAHVWRKYTALFLTTLMSLFFSKACLCFNTSHKYSFTWNNAVRDQDHFQNRLNMEPPLASNFSWKPGVLGKRIHTGTASWPISLLLLIISEFIIVVPRILQDQGLPQRVYNQMRQDRQV